MKYLFLLPIVLLFSCSTAKQSVYKVAANDIADIDLVLHKNQTFLIHFKVFEEKPPKKYQFTGKWSEKGESIRLIFKLDKDDLPDLKALFDPALDNSKSIRIIDKKTVEFKKTAKKINIWGISCEKISDKK
jgi:hypothetical protein